MGILGLRIISVIYVISLVSTSYANDILGCGGFVKSHVSLDFSKIEIGLYTKEGSLKEKTECAPNNGYYFLPLYEKGDYVLKVHPPPGWSFEPAKVSLHVDGVSDQCSTGQDVNFSFNGFGITGRVITAGQAEGPGGIGVQLVNDQGDVRDTVTTAGGHFHFTPVIPGKYTVKASHPRWKLEPSSAVVQVKEGNTALPVGALAVKGYDVKGSVSANGNPISGLYVLLYSKEESPKFRVEGCKTALLQGVPDSPICYSTTDAAGEFSFGLVPAGEYRLLALSKTPGQATLSYNVKPETVPFSVLHDSLYIKNAFEVTGFTVTSRVVSSTGAGVGNARVSLDGRAAGSTDGAGAYTLPALQPGAYTISVQHEQSQFDDIQLVISPNGAVRIPEARVARWRVCGAVTPPVARDVLVSGRGADARVPLDTQGKWCTFLPPGVYTARVDISEQEQRDGLQYYPLSHKITVGHSAVSGIAFSQLKAVVSGRVVCRHAAACAALRVTLRTLAPDGAVVGDPVTADVTDGKYMFKDVLPGSVELSVPTDRLCWAESVHNTAVTQETATVPDFVHTGHVLRATSSHRMEVDYVSSDGSEKGTLRLPAGASSHCVGQGEPRKYTLTPRGCHKVAPATATADTGAKPQTVNFVATAHAVVIRVTSPSPVDDLLLRVNMDGHGTAPVGPLPALARPAGGFDFEHTLYMKVQLVGAADCQPHALTLRAVRGLALAGRVAPPVAGVAVTLTADDLKLTQTTTEDGTYSFGPLDATKQYSITCEKESYVFAGPDDHGVIVAHKLAEIIVELVDDADGKPLQLIAIQPHQITDANVLVHTPNIDHYKTLRLTLALETSPDTPIFATKLDSAGYMVPLFLALVVVYWRRDAIVSRLAPPRAAPRPARPGARARPDVPDLANIDQLVSSVNAVGKKKKQ
ncbi:hypothetical protein MSG28_010587 [Choristoneura fumiferana]|uniref:Uncharacterized protein n=1 Tax=Choristoneura fumiferana TaxID=7141 RepID=A0ACC0KNM1_CHOFU|nr:hypothetical protein MSG28_010587 [Choristoneura fumiferana]